MHMHSLKAGFPRDNGVAPERVRHFNLPIFYILSQPFHLRLNSFILISSVDKSAATPTPMGN